MLGRKLCTNIFFVVFNILMNGTVVNSVFWAVESFMLLGMYQLFRGVPLCCFVLMLEAAHCSAVSVFARLHSVPSQKTYLLTYLLPYFHTPWSRVLLEKLTGFQLVKKFPAFYGTWRFITAVTSVYHLSLSWAILIQPIPHIPIPEETF